MKCEDALRYVGPYLDSELDPKTSFDVARHLEDCIPCRTRFESEGTLEQAMARELRRLQPGEDRVWERALRRAGRSWNRRWRRAALVGTALATAGVLIWIRTSDGPELAADLRKDYAKHVRGGAPLELASHDPRALEDFFRQQLGLSVPVPVPQGWRVQGGRRCFLRGVPAAFLLYRWQDREVVAYVLPSDFVDRFGRVGGPEDPLVDEAAAVRVAALRSGPYLIGAAGTVQGQKLLELCRAFSN